jgi:hypothetical protein
VSYYIRYVVTDDRAVTLPELEQVLQQVDPTCAIDGDLIVWGDEEYGQIDITCPGDPICDGDLNLLERLAEKKRHREVIRNSLRNAKSLVTVQPLWAADDATVEKILNPLWEWLLANRAGVLAVEGGHFFNQAGALN